MRIGITGANGQLGRELQAYLTSTGYTVFPFSRHDFDICEYQSYKMKLSHLKLDFLINAAAFTDVDSAETNIDAAFQVNATGPLNLAKFCRNEKIRLIHISTDSVFSSETPEFFGVASPTRPINTYGRSKEAGEKAVIAEYPEGSWIIRTAWIYGNFGGKFVHAIINNAEVLSTISVVDDQFGQPISTYALSAYIDAMMTQGSLPGIYHFVSQDFVSRFEFAQAILTCLGSDFEKIQPISTIIEPTTAKRPRYSLLKTEESSGNIAISMESWKYYLNDFLRGMKR